MKWDCRWQIRTYCMHNLIAVWTILLTQQPRLSFNDDPDNISVFQLLSPWLRDYEPLHIAQTLPWLCFSISFCIWTRYATIITYFYTSLVILITAVLAISPTDCIHHAIHNGLERSPLPHCWQCSCKISGGGRKRDPEELSYTCDPVNYIPNEIDSSSAKPPMNLMAV